MPNLIKVVFFQELIAFYRVPFFNALHLAPGIALVVVSGYNSRNRTFGEPEPKVVAFRWKRLRARHCNLGSRYVVWLCGLWKILRKERPEVVITTGNKRFIQNWVMYVLRLFGAFKLATFTHVYLHRPKSRIQSILESLYCQLEAKYLNDAILAYTDVEANYLLNRGVVSSRVFPVNNTLDVEGIRKLESSLTNAEVNTTCRTYQITSDKCIVFIGRLVPRKRPDLLLDYFREIFRRVPDSQLVIIGGGPMLDLLKVQAQGIPISFTNELFEEEKIAAIMRRCRFVFLPGYAGLTVNHAFAYGKPFVTFQRNDHSPEIYYLHHGENGYLLNPDAREENIALLADLLTNDETYACLAEGARRTADYLTMERMVGHFVGTICTMVDSKQGYRGINR